MHYYNEIDAYCVQWLYNLMDHDLIPKGDIDERSIEDVAPSDLDGYTQCHFFAGIAGWSLALQIAQWPTDRPCWTGSCPCQPFSAAGQQGGADDSRHLWPAFYRLIAECRPSVCFGEQVASKLGRTWLAAVRTDLESVGYVCGAADIPAAGVGAPHIRQRLWWVADSERSGRHSQHLHNEDSVESSTGREQSRARLGSGGESKWMANANGKQVDTTNESGLHTKSASSSRLGNTNSSGLEGRGTRSGVLSGESPASGHPIRAASEHDWEEADFIPCADGKQRPTQPGLRPLADGVPNGLGQLRAYGNAIVPDLAATFIKSYMEVLA